jgi:hypothetical protein
VAGVRCHGRDTTPQEHVQVLCNLIDFGVNLQEAGDAARFHHGGSSPPTVALRDARVLRAAGPPVGTGRHAAGGTRAGGSVLSPRTKTLRRPAANHRQPAQSQQAQRRWLGNEGEEKGVGIGIIIEEHADSPIL